MGNIAMQVVLKIYVTELTCRYRVEMFTEQEEEIHGEYGFKLVPCDDQRRCWWFKAEDDESKKEWEEVNTF